MPLSWQLFRIVCLLQAAGAVYYFFKSLVAAFDYGGAQYLFFIICFALVAIFSIFGFNMVNNNYPNKPVTGNQKSWFNRLFLLNFLLLAFLFTWFFISLRDYNKFTSCFTSQTPPLSLKLAVISTALMLTFQFIILFGMYSLRRLLFINAYRIKQFEFEEKE